MQRDTLTEALRALGDVLSDRGLAYTIAVVGGAALLLTGEHDRPTQDVDVVAVSVGDGSLRPRHDLPAALVEAAEDVAEVLGLDRDWLNPGALGVLSHRLPEGYERRLRPETFGGLTVAVLARQDLIRLKLFAASQEGPGSVHLNDLVSMEVDSEELDDAKRWVEGQFPGRPHPELHDVLGILWRRLA